MAITAERLFLGMAGFAGTLALGGIFWVGNTCVQVKVDVAEIKTEIRELNGKQQSNTQLFDRLSNKLDVFDTRLQQCERYIHLQKGTSL